MRNFIDFNVDAAQDINLGIEFGKQLEMSDNIKMSTWFKEQGYEVNESDCEKFINNNLEKDDPKLGWVY